LTVEALDVYLDKLADDGIIAFHITNSYLDLTRVLDGLARAKGLHGLVQFERKAAFTNDELLRLKRPSQWVVLARTREVLQHLAVDKRWEPLPNSPDSPVWTDDYSNILGVLRLGP
jgi:hypothetical protein